MDAKAKVQEIEDRVGKLGSKWEMVDRLAEIIVPKLSGKELIEVRQILFRLDLYLEEEIQFGLVQGCVPPEGREDDDLVFLNSFFSVAQKTYPSLAAALKMTYDAETGKVNKTEVERGALYLQAVDRDRSRPIALSIAGKR